MEICILNSAHQQQVYELFLNENFMGTRINDGFYLRPEFRTQNEQYFNSFVETYLSNLTNFTAMGAFVDNKLTGIIAAYQSLDEPSWYGKQIRSTGHKKIVQHLLDAMIDYQETVGRYKFYSLWNLTQLRYLKRFAFSQTTKERYDTFYEYYVPARHRCYYTAHWQILYNRVLLPVDTVVLCNFLKQKYRPALTVGGGL